MLILNLDRITSLPRNCRSSPFNTPRKLEKVWLERYGDRLSKSQAESMLAVRDELNILEQDMEISRNGLQVAIQQSCDAIRIATANRDAAKEKHEEILLHVVELTEELDRVLESAEQVTLPCSVVSNLIDLECFSFALCAFCPPPVKTLFLWY